MRGNWLEQNFDKGYVCTADRTRGVDVLRPDHGRGLRSPGRPRGRGARVVRIIERV